MSISLTPPEKTKGGGVYLAAYEPGFGLFAALPPPRFIRPAKKDARASFWDLPSGLATCPGVVGSGVW